jgi:hypothetical protein
MPYPEECHWHYIVVYPRPRQDGGLNPRGFLLSLAHGLFYFIGRILSRQAALIASRTRAAYRIALISSGGLY